VLFLLSKGVFVMPKRLFPGPKSLPGGLLILYEDQDILVVDKPAGLLVIATGSEKSRTAYFILTDYVRKGYPKSPKRLFIVHRLDRETSGVLVFAKSEEAKRRLQDHWGETEKNYLAVVHGKMEKSSDTITTYLAENRAHVVYSTTDALRGKLSHTAYRVIGEARGFSLLDVLLLTGRKHQIRVHLSHIDHPVVGDRKYGKVGETHRRMALHARSISFKHPISGKNLSLEAEVPIYFEKLVGPLGRETGPSELSLTKPAKRARDPRKSPVRRSRQ
jgi:RluA family pseudouridine synthase